MRIIFSQADVAAFKATILGIARDARNMPLPEGSREVIRRIVADTVTFGAVEIAELQSQFDQQHLCIVMTEERGIAITVSTEALQTHLDIVAEYYEFAFDIAAMAMPLVRFAKKFAKKIKASTSAATSMLMAKSVRGSWAEAERDIRAAEAADLARQRSKQKTDWSAV